MKRLKGGDRVITIKGLVIPVEWDEKGNVVAAAISTPSEDEYLIDKDHYKGEELLHLIQQEVEVTGLAKEHKDKRIIAVQKYILRKHNK